LLACPGFGAFQDDSFLEQDLRTLLNLVGIGRVQAQFADQVVLVQVLIATQTLSKLVDRLGCQVLHSVLLLIVEGAELKLIGRKGCCLPNRWAQVQERLAKRNRLEIIRNLKRADTGVVVIPRRDAGSHK